jgi:putative phosphoesterase
MSRSLRTFEKDAVDVICFGHSHQPVCEQRGEIWLVNPGSPTDKRTQPRYSYAVLEIEQSRVVPRLVFFDRQAG